MQFFLPFHWPRAPRGPANNCPQNNGLHMHNVVRPCLAAINNIPLTLKWKHAFLLLPILLLLHENGRSLRFTKIFIKKETWWSNDKTIIELGHRKISWFVSVSQINYFICLRSARHWQITIFCSQPPPIITVDSENWGRREELLRNLEVGWEGMAWEIFHFQPIISVKFNKHCVCHRPGYKENSYQATVFLQMSMKFKGSSLLSSYIPYYNRFIKTTRKQQPLLRVPGKGTYATWKKNGKNRLLTRPNFF